MKHLTFFVVLLHAAVLCIGQVKEVSISLEPSESLIGQVNLGEAGFLLRTSNRIFRYSPACEKIWERNIDRQASKVISSPDGSMVYLINANTINPFKKSQHIYQLDGGGNLKEFTLEASKEYGTGVMAIFASKSHLFYLATDDLNKKEEGFFLNRFDAGSMSHKKDQATTSRINRWILAISWTTGWPSLHSKQRH